MKKIKILFDTDILVPVWLGTSIGTGLYYASYNIFRELLNRENADVYCYSGSGHLGRLKFALEKNNFTDLKIPKLDFIYNLLAKADYYRFSSYYKSKNNIISRIKGAIIKYAVYIPLMGIAVIMNSEKKISKHFDNYFSPVFAIPASIESDPKINKFVILYDTIPLVLPQVSGWSAQNSPYMKVIRQINKEDNYFAISECTKQDFIKYVPNIDKEKITVTLLAAGETYRQEKNEAKNCYVRAKYKIPEGKRYFLSLCTIDPRKNLVFAVKNFIKFVKNNHIEDLVFVLAGGHWKVFSAAISKEIFDLDDLKNLIIQTGYVDEEDVAPLYSNAECFVYLSLYEGFGLPPLEAMQCGIPVISSKVTSLPEVVGDAGIMINPQQDSELIEAYNKIYSDAALRKELSAKGLERAKLFSWKKCVDIIMDKIQEVNNISG